jgi:hypothetical protein
MPQLIARASTTVRNKNIAMIVLCVGFLCWFAYDGFYAWPQRDDNLVGYMKGMTEESPPRLDPKYRPLLDSWKGWNNETPEARQKMSEIAHTGHVENWKNTLDMSLQRWIVAGLVFAVIGTIWWTIRCQQRRVIADENSVSPAKGVDIPWDKIKVVDNARWKSSGIVTITYSDPHGQTRQAKFDDYETEREPLIQILDLMGEKAQSAQFLPKEEPAAPEA